MSLLRYERGWGNFPRRVYLATPVGDSKPFDAYTAPLPNLALALAKAKIGLDFAQEGGNCHVDDARNALVRHFLTTDCDDLVFVDADVGFRPEAFVKLLGHDVDIVGGAYPLKQDDLAFPVRWLDEETHPVDDLVQVAGMPTGFLRIRRHVLETLADDATKFATGGWTYPLVFERQSRDGGRLSGDLAFCDKARQRGFFVYVDPDMTLTHTGLKTWTGNLGDHLRAQHGRASHGFEDALHAIRSHYATGQHWKDLFDGWGNPWAAPPELLSACYHSAWDSKGPILETGSGLSTLVLGLGAEMSGQIVYALEHDVDWYWKTRKALNEYRVRNVELRYAPLKDYGGENSPHKPDRWWYDFLYSDYGLPGQYDLLVLDGPQRRFGRDGLFITSLYHGLKDARWLMDDADDPAHISMIETYAPERMPRMKIIQSELIPGRAFAAFPRPKAD